MTISGTHLRPRAFAPKAGFAALGLCAALALAACADTGWGEKQQGGTAIGAGGGAVLGAVVGGWQGAAIGAVAGGVVGNLVGRDMDQNERRRAEEATWNSARDGRRSDWNYDGGGRGYSEPASDYYMRNGQECRDFNQYMTKNGRDYRDRVTVCRDPRSGGYSRL